MAYPSIAVVGPTACGKTRRAVELALSLGGEIISADSRQVYRGMSIGTGKDLCEYGEIPYHLIDIADAGEKYNLHRYLRDFHKAYSEVLDRGHLPVICGGTGMYLENAIRGIRLPEVPENKILRKELEGKTLDELTAMLASMKALHNNTDTDTVKRAVRAIEIQKYYEDHPDESVQTSADNARSLDCVVIGLDIPREVRRERITMRLRSRLEEGMADEIRSLLDRGIPAADLIYYGLEYKYVTLYVTGVLTYDEMFSQLETAIHQFAKRQMTWFRGMERRGIHIHWLPYDIPGPDLIRTVRQLIQDQ